VNLIFLLSTIALFFSFLINLISNHQTNRDEKGVREEEEERKERISGEKGNKCRKKKKNVRK
jgi:TRAP-type C4-dicarboxylate transport system permease small subunit